MSDDNNIIETIKHMVDLREIIPDLKKEGTLFFRKCLFHEETMPSMVVYADHYYCHGCRASGDVFDYYEKVKGIGLEEAQSLLAEQLGIANVQPVTNNLSEGKRKLRSFVDRAEENLHKGGKGLDYLFGRKFSLETIKKYRFGYIDNAIVIPIWNSRSEIATVSFRYLDGEKRYKVSNTPLFSRKNDIYIHPSSRHGSGPLYVCEGQFDAAALSQAGVRSAATLGKSVGDEQIKQLVKIAGDYPLVIVPDPGFHDYVMSIYLSVVSSFDYIPIYYMDLTAGDANDYLEQGLAEECKKIFPAILVGALGKKLSPDAISANTRLYRSSYIMDRPILVRYLSASWGIPEAIIEHTMKGESCQKPIS